MTVDLHFKSLFNNLIVAGVKALGVSKAGFKVWVRSMGLLKVALHRESFSNWQ